MRAVSRSAGRSAALEAPAPDLISVNVMLASLTAAGFVRPIAISEYLKGSN